MFILDANFLINVNREIPADSGDEFWDKLLVLAEQEYLKVPETVIVELERGNDALGTWIKANKKVLIIKTSDIYDKLSEVLSEYTKGYKGMPLDDLDQLSAVADPYVIAHALQLNATVVTSEVPCRGDYLTQAPKNRKIPDICNALGVDTIKTLVFFRNVSML